MDIKSWVAALTLASAGAAQAITGGGNSVLSEGFDNVGSLGAAGWVMTNNSAPAGGTDWFQGNDGIFASQAGAANAYIASNYLAANGDGAVSNWLLTPMLSLDNGMTVSFAVRAAGDGLLDSLEVRLSTNGASSDVGSTPSSLGDFATLLGSYASSTDEGWVMQTYTIAGLGGPLSGRIGFRYLVGDTAVDGNYLGIDTLTVSAVPEPAAALLLVIGMAGLLAHRRLKN